MTQYIKPITKTEAIERAGGKSSLAAIAKVSPSAITQWPEVPLPAAQWTLLMERPEWFLGKKSKNKLKNNE